MKLSDFVNLKKVVVWGNRKDKTSIQANLGEVSSCGKDSVEALSNLKDTINNHFKHLYFRRYLKAKDGAVFHLYYANGFVYEIVRFSENGERVNHSCCLCGFDKDKAVKDFENHFKQYDDSCPAPLPQAAIVWGN